MKTQILIALMIQFGAVTIFGQNQLLPQKERDGSIVAKETNWVTDYQKLLDPKSLANGLRINIDSNIAGELFLDSAVRSEWEDQWVGGWEANVCSEELYKYNGEGLIVERVKRVVDSINSKLENHSRWEYLYDSGNIIYESFSVWDSKDGVWKIKDQQETEYTANTIMSTSNFTWDIQADTILCGYKSHFLDDKCENYINYKWDNDKNDWTLKDSIVIDKNEYSDLTLYLRFDWNPDSSAFIKSYKVEYEYRDSLLVSQEAYNWNSYSSYWEQYRGIVYEYDEYGYVSSIDIDTVVFVFQGVRKLRMLNTYDDQQRITKITTEEKFTCEVCEETDWEFFSEKIVKYDINGFIAVEEEHNRSESGDKQKEKIVYSRNDVGLILETQEYYWDGYQYDWVGAIKYIYEINDFGGKAKVTGYEWNSGAGWHNIIEYYTYDEFGRIIEGQALFSDGRISNIIYEYDTVNLIVSMILSARDPETKKWGVGRKLLYEYSDDLEIVKQRYYWGRDDIFYGIDQYDYYYDDKGMLVEIVEYDEDIESGILEKYKKTEFSYNELGGLIYEVSYLWSEESSFWRPFLKKEMTKDHTSGDSIISDFEYYSETWYLQGKEVYQFDSKGRIKSWILDDFLKVEYIYDQETNSIDQILEYYENNSTGEWQLKKKWETEYDFIGNDRIVKIPDQLIVVEDCYDIVAGLYDMLIEAQQYGIEWGEITYYKVFDTPLLLDMKQYSMEELTGNWVFDKEFRFTYSEPEPIGISSKPKPMESFSLYPNPTDGFFYCEISNPKIKPDKGVISIISASGELMDQYQIESERCKIDLSSVKSGVYIVKLDNGKASYTKKLIKLGD